MAKMGCAKCGKMMKKGGVKKMAKGGMPDKIMGPAKKPFAAGIPYFTGAGQTGPESMKKGGSKFPDKNGDGKVTKADILIARGVIKKKTNMPKAKFGESVNVQPGKIGKVTAVDRGYANIGMREPDRNKFAKGGITKKAPGGPIGTKKSRTYTQPAAPKREGYTQQMWEITVDSSGKESRKLIGGKPEPRGIMMKPRETMMMKKSKDGGPIIDKLKEKLKERKITRQIKKSVKSSGKIIK
jgi:hypothetical protein